MKKSNTLYLVRAGLIAALYAALTVTVAFFLPIMYGQVQFRVSEALTVLPLFLPEAVPGLFVGCVVANAVGVSMGQAGAIDIVVGSLASLLAAVLTRATRRITFKGLPLLSMFFPVIVNAVIVGAELTYLTHVPFYLNFLWVFLGQAICCYGLGIPLFLAIKRIGPTKIFGSCDKPTS